MPQNIHLEMVSAEAERRLEPSGRNAVERARFALKCGGVGAKPFVAAERKPIASLCRALPRAVQGTQTRTARA